MSEYEYPRSDLSAGPNGAQSQPEAYDEPFYEAQEPTPAPPPQKPKRKKRVVRKTLWALLIVLAALVGYLLFEMYFASGRNVQQIYLVPPDAAIIIHSSDPVRDWKRFSQSEPWKGLKQVGSFAEIAENTEALDEIIHDNSALLALVGKRDLTISMHKARSDAWDFLILIDLQRASKIRLLKSQIERILKLGGGEVTTRNYKGLSITEMRDPQTRDVLYLAFIDNHFAVSYTSRLVEAAIDERDNPQIGLNDGYIRADQLVGGKGLCRVYFNYAYLPDFLTVYMGRNEFIDMFCNSMEFAGLWFDANKNKVEVKGHTLFKEEGNPYVEAFIRSGRQRMRAHEVLSGRTAFYANFGFDNASSFVQELEQVMAETDKAGYDSYKSARDKLEKYFDISMEADFLSWMSGEFALTQSEPGLLGYDPDFILAIRARSIKDARERMEHLEKMIRRRSPIRISDVTYKGYEVNYVELKGFFRLFFGKLFDKFETPFYTYVDDYVVFSNKSASLLSFIEDYEQKNRLASQEGFKTMLSNVSHQSTAFVYIDMPRFFPLLQPMLTPDTRKDLQDNRDVFYSFPQWGLQVVGDGREASMQLVMDYKPYEPEPEPVLAAEAIDELDKELDEDADTEKELMNELKRFYVEKFQGNVLREFYPDGALKSESETRDGKRNGRHREYYENGALRSRGKYADNRPKGTWKYYTEEGRFERKERY